LIRKFEIYVKKAYGGRIPHCRSFRGEGVSASGAHFFEIDIEGLRLRIDYPTTDPMCRVDVVNALACAMCFSAEQPPDKQIDLWQLFGENFQLAKIAAMRHVIELEEEAKRAIEQRKT
jgi:hypothetical protein